MQYPEDLRYSEEHEWVRLEGTRATVGITDFAQDALGDVVFVALPEVGGEVAAAASIAEVESTKSVSEIYAPIPGRIVERNEALDDHVDGDRLEMLVQRLHELGGHRVELVGAIEGEQRDARSGDGSFDDGHAPCCPSPPVDGELQCARGTFADARSCESAARRALDAAARAVRPDHPTHCDLLHPGHVKVLAQSQ